MTIWAHGPLGLLMGRLERGVLAALGAATVASRSGCTGSGLPEARIEGERFSGA